MWPYLQSMGGSRAFLGGVVAAFSVGQLVGAPFWGAISNRTSYRLVLYITIMIRFGGNFLYAIAGDLPHATQCQQNLTGTDTGAYAQNNLTAEIFGCVEARHNGCGCHRTSSAYLVHAVHASCGLQLLSRHVGFWLWVQTTCSPSTKPSHPCTPPRIAHRISHIHSSYPPTHARMHAYSLPPHPPPLPPAAARCRRTRLAPRTGSRSTARTPAACLARCTTRRRSLASKRAPTAGTGGC